MVLVFFQSHQVLRLVHVQLDGCIMYPETDLSKYPEQLFHLAGGRHLKPGSILHAFKHSEHAKLTIRRIKLQVIPVVSFNNIMSVYITLDIVTGRIFKTGLAIAYL